MTKIIVTLGPATNSFEKISMIKSKGVDFVRVNMSHSSIDDLKYFIDLAKKADIQFIVDTEGSQVRTGNLSTKSISYKENETIRLHKNEIIENNSISLRPKEILDQLQEGDLLYIDFDTLVVRVSDISSINKGYIEATIISSGNLGNNKGVVIDPKHPRKFNIPTLSKKDNEAIKIGIKNKIGYIAMSFVRSGEAVKEVRRITKNKMKIISKIECKDALENLNDIISESDYLLIDRGDLSKEIPIEKIPFTQKIIVQRAKQANKFVYVATNLLESMILNRKPTRAEVHDIINTIVEGAYGLTLAAETAIGKYPIGCINMLNKIIHHSNIEVYTNEIKNKEKKFVQCLETSNYLLDETISHSIVQPNGGKLINRVSQSHIDVDYVKSIEKISLNENQYLDFEQIAIGTYSPLEGFMTKLELDSVLDTLRLPNGTIWPMPILLDVSLEKSRRIKEGDTVALLTESNEFIGTIHVKDKYSYDKQVLAKKFYGHNDQKHPGVKIINSLNPVFIGGDISLYKRRNYKYSEYSLTPKQTRKLFEEKNWLSVVGFHTRNVIHRAHEFIQLSALSKGKCDGIFLHPVVGKKKSGDYNSSVIIKSYEIMQKHFYPEEKTVLSVFSTYSRYGGEKEALFTALCRKNYGCSHFIIGRNHTDSKASVDNNDSTTIFSKFQDIGMEIIRFNNVYYSKSQKRYFEEDEYTTNAKKDDKMFISGTEARELFKNQKLPPSWFMRPEVSAMIINAIKANEDVFVL